MSPSDPGAPPSPATVPPEVLAIAVALVVEWQAAEEAAASLATEPEPVSPWRWSGRRWERSTGHRWS
jgi:hypothetical protein